MQVSTLKQRVDNEADFRDCNVVKVVTDLEGFALYFSRASVPGNLSGDWIEANPIYRHVGLYAYRKECLLAFTTWERAPYEGSEGLETVCGFMEHGVKIRVVETEHKLIGGGCTGRFGARACDYGVNLIHFFSCTPVDDGVQYLYGGGLAQLGERLHGMQEVTSSSLVSSTIFFARSNVLRDWGTPCLIS